ncbi:aspartic proteinase CDR1-like [Euphorbia lathyris]|uniref:aspartic proteinase CDR1-like n=1 Tax=Euphorbia lathyris TaxID=212925 RepID=UPI003313C504
MPKHTFLILLLPLSAFILAQSQTLSFTAQLIHTDSPASPFFNASQTTLHRLTNALQRSSDRVNRVKNLLSNAVKAFQSPLVYYNGDYLMRVTIGTTEILLNVALGSDITWVPCLNGACSQSCNGRIFDPTQSSTFKTLACDAFRCQMTTGASCSFPDCVFSCSSGSQGDTTCPSGVLSTDIFTLTTSSDQNQQPIRLPDTAFVCGNGVGYEYPGVGSVGLGHGSLSLLSRIYHLIDGKFSYCLVPYTSDQPSRMNFGLKGVVSGGGVVSLPLKPVASRYILQLNGVEVGGGVKLEYDYTFPFQSSTSLFIDPGIMFTHLPDSMYSQLEQQVRTAVRMEPVQSDNTQRLSLCYRYTPDFNPPLITMQFVNGIVELGTGNSFIRTSEDTICLAFAPSSGGEAVYGSWQQMNFLVGYDLENGSISFKGTDCTQYQ